MVTPQQSKAALRVVTDEAVGTANALLSGLSGAPEAQRAALLDLVPAIVGYFAEGSAALAVDFYEEERDRAGVRDRTFTTEFVVADRTVKIRRGIAWAADPLFSEDTTAASKRLAEVVSLETARPYRDTIITNRRSDPYAVGWRRETGVCCGFCRMLGARGAVYKTSTVRFAAHPHCDCTAVPVFQGHNGPEADVIQYIASKRSRTAQQRKELREYLSTYYPD